MVMRTDMNHYNTPFFFHTNERIRQYLETVTGKTIHELVIELEGFCISGMQGT